MGKCSLTRCFGCEPFGELDLVADFCHTRRRARAVHPLKHVERIERRDLFLVLRARRVLVPVTRAVKSFSKNNERSEEFFFRKTSNKKINVT